MALIQTNQAATMHATLRQSGKCNSLPLRKEATKTHNVTSQLLLAIQSTNSHKNVQFIVMLYNLHLVDNCVLTPNIKKIFSSLPFRSLWLVAHSVERQLTNFDHLAIVLLAINQPQITYMASFMFFWVTNQKLFYKRGF